MLFGKFSQNNATLCEVIFAPNMLESTVKFEIDPIIVVDVLIKAEQEGLDFIGLFHSHPAPAMPSSIDFKFMKLWGDALWLIMSTTNGKLAAYHLKNDILEEVTIRFR
jgi:proteasome lid subunit RPN8/RPN11